MNEKKRNPVAITRRDFIKLSAGTVALIVASCATPPVPTPTAAQSTVAPATPKPASTTPPTAAAGAGIKPDDLIRPGGKTVIFRVYEAYPGSELPILKRFVDKNPGTSIQFISTPYGNYRDKMIADFTANTTMDVVEIPETELAAWVDAGWLLPLDGMPGVSDLLQDAYPMAKQVVTYKGKVRAFPHMGDSFGFVYDTKVYSDAGLSGPPKNLDELQTQMLAIKKAGINEFPLSLALKNQPGQFWSMWAMVFASGGDLFDADLQPTFSGKDSTLGTVLQWWYDALNTWKIVGPNDFQLNWSDSSTTMRAGTVAAGIYGLNIVKALNDPVASKIAGRAHIGLVPGLQRNDVGTVAYNHCVGLAATTKDKDLAFKVLYSFVGKDENGNMTAAKERFIDQGGRGPYMSVMNDPDIKKLVSDMTLGNAPLYDQLRQLGKQRLAAMTPWYSEWESAHYAAIQDVLQQKTKIPDALTASAKNFTDLKAKWK